MNSDYWKDRELKWLEQCKKEEVDFSKNLDEIYQMMEDEIKEQIEIWYSRFAEASGMSMAEARKYLDETDIDEYARRAKRYCELAAMDMRENDDKNAEIYFSEEANAEMARYNAEMKISRYKMLLSQIRLRELAGLSSAQAELEKDLIKRTQDELKRQAGILGNTVQDNAKMAEIIVHASFHGATFSERIWGKQQEYLHKQLTKLLSEGLILGKSPQALASKLSKVTGVTKKQAQRLMRTEMARVQAMAQHEAYKQCGFNQFEFLTNPGCCDECKKLDGHTFELDDMQSGVNAPPLHPNCRCFTAPAMDRDRVEKDLGIDKITDDDVKEFDEWCDYAEEHENDQDFITWEEWKKRRKNKDKKENESDKNDTLLPHDKWKLAEAQNIQTKQVAIKHFADNGISFVDGKISRYKVDEQWISETATWHSKFTNMFKGFDSNIINKLPEIKMLPDGKAKTFYGCFSYYNSGEVSDISLKSSTFHTYDKAVKTAKENAKPNKSGIPSKSGSSPIHTFVHEYGHYVSHSLKQMNKDEKWESKFIKSCINAFSEQSGKPLNGLKDMREHLSLYGATNYSECFAEAFSEFFGEDDPREFAKVFGEELMKELEKWK